MKFGYAIVYVPDVPEAVDFYERAFGLSTKMIHESNLYAEMETGDTVLAFAGEAMATANGVDVVPNRRDQSAAGIEIALVTDEVDQAYQRAVNAGASALVAPETKPWGQTVSYVRDLNGVLVELCSPMN